MQSYAEFLFLEKREMKSLKSTQRRCAFAFWSPHEPEELREKRRGRKQPKQPLFHFASNDCSAGFVPTEFYQLLLDCDFENVWLVQTTSTCVLLRGWKALVCVINLSWYLFRLVQWNEEYARDFPGIKDETQKGMHDGQERSVEYSR